MEVKLQHEDGFTTTATYLLPDHLLAEAVFEGTRDRARHLSDAAELLYGTEAYKHLRPFPLSRRVP
jgi:hypothetical protein